MKLNKYLIMVLIMVSVLSCKTRKLTIDKKNSQSVTHQADSVVIKKDSLSTKKYETIKTSEQKNNIQLKEDNKYIFTKYLPFLDASGKQLIDSKEERNDQKQKSDLTINHQTETNKKIDSLKYSFDQQFKHYKDSIGESQSKIKQVDSNSTIGANLPWWVWLIGLVGLIVFFAFKFK